MAVRPLSINTLVDGYLALYGVSSCATVIHFYFFFRSYCSGCLCAMSIESLSASYIIALGGRGAMFYSTSELRIPILVRLACIAGWMHVWGAVSNFSLCFPTSLITQSFLCQPDSAMLVCQFLWKRQTSTFEKLKLCCPWHTTFIEWAVQTCRIFELLHTYGSSICHRNFSRYRLQRRLLLVLWSACLTMCQVRLLAASCSPSQKTQSPKLPVCRKYVQTLLSCVASSRIVTYISNSSKYIYRLFNL